MANFNVTSTSPGLNPYSVKVPDAGIYFIDIKTTLANLTSSGLQSALIITMSKNGSPFYTGLASSEGAHSSALCAAGDTLSVAFSSSAPADLGLNVVKSTIAIGLGV